MTPANPPLLLGPCRRSVTTTALDILRTNGALSLWKGSAPAVLRMGLGVGLHMVLIEAMSEALRRPMRPAIDRLPQGTVADIGVSQAAGSGAGQGRLSSVNAALAGGASGRGIGPHSVLSFPGPGGIACTRLECAVASTSLYPLTPTPPGCSPRSCQPQPWQVAPQHPLSCAAYPTVPSPTDGVCLQLPTPSSD